MWAKGAVQLSCVKGQARSDGAYIAMASAYRHGIANGAHRYEYQFYGPAVNLSTAQYSLLGTSVPGTTVPVPVPVLCVYPATYVVRVAS